MHSVTDVQTTYDANSRGTVRWLKSIKIPSAISLSDCKRKSKLTFFDHADREAFLKPTELASVTTPLVDDAAAPGQTDVL